MKWELCTALAFLWFLSLLALLFFGLALLMGGCAGSFTGRAPETRTLLIPAPQAQTYTRAVQTLAAMGAEMTSQDGFQALHGVVHGVVILSVSLSPGAGGTQVRVTGSIPPGKLTWGTMTELDEFCTRLQAPGVAHAR